MPDDSGGFHRTRRLYVLVLEATARGWEEEEVCCLQVCCVPGGRGNKRPCMATVLPPAAPAFHLLLALCT